MPGAPPAFTVVIERLHTLYGEPERPPTTDPFELVVWENCAYLVDDERRARVFAALRAAVGTTPQALLAAPAAVLADAIREGGMKPAMRADKLVRCAEIAAERFEGDVASALSLPLPKARRAIQRFPSMGPPGAERVLLLAGAHAVLALDSNGLRVLLRLGYGREGKDYAATYRSVREAVDPDVPDDVATVQRAHLLLRLHGKELCKNAAPRCDPCPLADRCGWHTASVS